MKGLRIFAAVLSALVWLAGAGNAADTPLALKGRVIDENGLPVGDAQVKLEYAGGHVFSGATDSVGVFTVNSLEPGEYTARVEKAGFFVLQEQKLQLAADATEFTFVLNHQQEVREKVDVTVTSQRVEPSETTQSANLSGTEIRDIPVPSSHDLQQSLVAMPQVLRDNGDLLHIAGARNTQTLYLLDGFEIGDPVSGVLDARLNVDAVRSAEIETGRFGAEYYHPGAAVLRLDTPEGDDRWRFGATDFIPGINVEEGVRLGNFYPRFSVSGPILKKRFWFSEYLSATHTLSVIKGQPTNANLVETWGGDALTRFLWHVSPKHSLHGSFLYNKTRDTDLGLDALHPESTSFNLAAHRVFGSLKDQVYWQETLFEFGGSTDDGYSATRPQGAEPYVLLVNGAQGNYFQEVRLEGKRLQFFFDAIRTELHWHGTHTLSLGGNVSGVELLHSAARTEIQAFLKDNKTSSRLTTFAGSPQFEVSNTLLGAFVQDNWSPKRYLVVQAGMRMDADRAISRAMAEPRVSLNVLPFADNRGKFSIGWGMYNIPLNLSVIGQTYDQQQVDTVYTYQDQNPNCIAVCISGPATSQFVRPVSGLKEQYFTIASVGWQQRVGGNTLVSVELLARDQHHGLVFETLSPGQIGSEFLLRTSRRDKYRGATISARHTFANTAALFGSYTRSRASTDQVLDPTLGAMFFAAQQPGPLSWDAPNRFLSWGSVPTPVWGILFTYLLEYRTGFPYSVINQQQFLIGAANAQRFPDYASVTIGLEKKFGLSHRVFAVRVSAINIFNRENPDVVVNNIDAPNFGAFSGGQGRAVTARLRFVGRK
ncbi:MAG: carboxypeptidase regulatory-like domain-containing protein [Candidatus Acidiferrum sp.]